ncbi:MAG: GNAT family N-acetyltransferase, partial [Microbacterium sp.]|nr:GNAT family N-acetyltransferase [Microbacterium sp.]
MTTVALTITPLTVPATLDADDAAEFRHYGELNALICDEAVGLPGLAPDAAQMLPAWQDTADTLHLGFVAREGDEIVGMVTVDYAQEDGANTASVDVLLPRAYEGRGVEDALLAHAEADASARGRSILQLWTLHRPEESERMLTPRTGWGRVPSNPLSDLAERSGYAFEQVERNSEFTMPEDDSAVRTALADALAAGHRIVNVNDALFYYVLGENAGYRYPTAARIWAADWHP